MYDKYIAVDMVVTNRVKVTGEIVNPEPDKAFAYTAKLTGLKHNKTYRTGTGEGDAFVPTGSFTADGRGMAEFHFTLKNGESLTFEKLPTGAQIAITQAASEYDARYSAVIRNSEAEPLELHHGQTNQPNQELTAKATRLDIDQGVVRFEFENILEVDGLPVRVIVLDREDDSPIAGSRVQVLGPEIA